MTNVPLGVILVVALIIGGIVLAVLKKIIHAVVFICVAVLVVLYLIFGGAPNGTGGLRDKLFGAVSEGLHVAYTLW